ncbi:MAG: RHS repeat-associated core domain-containing protein, partial [Pseudomonadota bacterium]|nr:RHS repeat-associated core domain-containing protein [Pseudomonadota bacterium]
YKIILDGETVAQVGDDLSPASQQGYTGHVGDNTGLVYMQARYYDPVIGRFYSNDPIGFRDVHSFNRYAYANNNPYKYTDPDGRDAVSVQIEYNLPSAISMLNASSFVTDTLGVTIPEGFNISATVSFPGFSDNGKWGFRGSFNAVFGGEFGVDDSVAKASGIKDTLKSVRKAFGSGRLTGEIDYNFAKNGVTDVQNGLSDNQISAMAVVGGGQVSVNNSGDITGFGVKAGAGINAGAVVEKPIAGFAIEEDKGFVKTGGN